MKRYVALAMALICALCLMGCSILNMPGYENDTYSGTYVVLEASSTSLIVAEVADDGEVNELNKYSVPNAFSPSYEIVEGTVIEIKHNGIALETYPMQFAVIYSMTYHNNELGYDVTVNLN